MGGVQDLCEDVQLAMWKNFIDKVFEVVGKCHKTKGLVIYNIPVLLVISHVFFINFSVFFK